MGADARADLGAAGMDGRAPTAAVPAGFCPALRAESRRHLGWVDFAREPDAEPAGVLRGDCRNGRMGAAPERQECLCAVQVMKIVEHRAHGRADIALGRRDECGAGIKHAAPYLLQSTLQGSDSGMTL